MHTHIAQAAVRKLQLDRMILVPAHQSPLKKNAPVASDRDRLAMIRLAIRDLPELEASDVELKQKGISYTVDTLRSFKDNHTLYLLMGADVLPSFHLWKKPDEIRKLATLVIVNRPGTRLPRGATTLRVKGRSLSSSEIRRKIAAGEPIDKLVHPAVCAYIMARGLYHP
jgi:nicotinate-nucleotide adenylyltransferase